MRKLEELKNVPYASVGARIGHYFIDLLVFYFFIFVIGFFTVEENFLLGMGLMILIYPMYFAYYIVMEGAFGATLGKMLIGSIVVDDYANKISYRDATIRTFIRLVPFEVFSFFGKDARGWHDRWAHTHVIKRSELENLQFELSRAYHDFDNFGKKEDINFEHQENS